MARNWAICIGINQYDDLQPLNFAVRDAERMKDWLIDKAGFPKSQVYYFADNAPPITDASATFKAKPTYATLIGFLDRRFNKPFLKPGDNLWFFFSGHGSRYQERDYLMFADSFSEPSLIERTAISTNFIVERLRKSGAENVMLFIDACREGDKSGRGIELEKEQGIITIASCSPNEFSYEIDELQHGSFTYALLESLDFQGENNCATVERLNRRLRERVREINSVYGKPRQTPRAVIEPASKYHLILLPEYIQPTDNDIAVLKNDALKAELEGNLSLARSLWTRLVRLDTEEALVSLERIWEKSRQQGTEREVALEPVSDKSGEKTTSSNLGELDDLEDNSDESNALLDAVNKSPGNKNEELESIEQKLDSLDKISEESLKQLDDLMEMVQDQDLKLEEKTTKNSSELSTFEFAVVTVNEQGKEIQREIKQAEYYAEDLGNGVTLDMVSIPGGSFWMGTEDQEIARLCKTYDNDWFKHESPQHKVNLADFFMGRYLVTQAEWREVASWQQVEKELDPDPSRFKEDYEEIDRWIRPVENVSWEDAKEFCNRLSNRTNKEYRLPTEAEWEYACRSVISYQLSVNSKEWNEQYHQPFHFGETISTDLVNYRGTDWEDEGKVYPGNYGKGSKGIYRKQTTPVGYFKVANNFGLFDMHGNLFEWCEDDWHKNYQDAPTYGDAWLSGKSNTKVIRGGSWNNVPFYCRSAFRSKRSRGYCGSIFGFRIAYIAFRAT